MNTLNQPVRSIPQPPAQAPGTVLIDGHQFSRRLAADVLEFFPADVALALTHHLTELRNGLSAMSTYGYRPKCPIPTRDRRTVEAGLAACFDMASNLFEDFKHGEERDSIARRKVATKLHRSIRVITAALRKVPVMSEGRAS